MTKEQYFKYKNKNSIKKWVVLLLIALVVTGAFTYAPKKITGVEAAATTSGVALNNEIPTETGTKGTATNPFVILEIVPYEGYAEVGYLIDGCEPVDMTNESLRTDANPGMTTITSTLASTAVGDNRYRFPDETNIPSSFKDVNGKITLYGYYEKVAENTGYFVQTKNATSGAIDYVKVGANKGNVVWHSVYGMTADKVEANRLLNSVGETQFASRTDTGYKTGYEYVYKNNNYFLKNILGIAEKDIPDYHVVVKTIEPDELNQQIASNSTSNWVTRSDLIVISPKSHIGQLPQVWEKFKKSSTSVDSKHATDFGGNDLSWNAVLQIFKKVNVDKDYAGIIFDWTVYTNPPSATKKTITPYQVDYNGKITSNTNGSETGNSNNVYKLALMMRTMDPVVFYNLFLNDNNGTETPLVKDGLFTVQPTTDAKTYWSQSTFMPTQKDGSLAWNTHWDALWNTYKLNPNMGDNVSVAGRIYSYNGDCSLSQNLVNNSITQTKYTQELFDYTNVNKEANVPATAIEYILSKQVTKNENDKGSLSILDIEPCKSYTLTQHTIRMYMPYYTGIISIVPMTSSEFVGKIEDLNSRYDMIYLGMNCSAFNTSSQSVSGTTLTVPYYNDSTLNAKIYLHVGDLITISSTYKNNYNWLGTASNQTARMPGNDISASKKTALQAYALAGYPILVDSKLYNTGTNLTMKLVDKTSNIYNFIVDNKAKEDIINTESTSANTLVQKYIKVEKPQLILNSQPTKYVGTTDSDGKVASSNYINNTNINYRKLNFNYTIADSDSSKRYTINLYIDANADGRFAAEELNMSEDGVTPNVAHDFSKPLFVDYFGVIPWKFEIVDESNSLVRDSETGYSAVKRTSFQKEKIRILQINQNTSDSNKTTLNLQDNVTNKGLFYKYTCNLNDYDVTFETITIKDFENRFNPTLSNGKRFLTASAKDTDQLTQNYDMLIFGFADCYGNIDNTYGALDDVKYYISCYKSVLFTHDVTSFNNVSTSFGYNFNLLFRDILGMDRFASRSTALVAGTAHDTATNPNGSNYVQIHGYTYYMLKRMSASGQGLTYSGLATGDTGACPTTTVTKLNDGQLTEYPYQIGDSIQVASTHGQYYQLNMEDPEIVVWYCLASGTNGDAMYNYSPNDASNNYYIYNKGNITYSGVGHSTVGSSEAEVKLFINTMIAAYKTAIKEPAIEVLNASGVSGDSSQYAMYLNTDSNEVTEYKAGDTLKIDFIPWDYNFLSKDLGVTVSVGGINLKIYDKNGNEVKTEFVNAKGEKMIKLSNGNTYSIQYDKGNFNTVDLRKLKFTIENGKGLIGYSTLQLLNRTFFDLE